MSYAGAHFTGASNQSIRYEDLADTMPLVWTGLEGLSTIVLARPVAGDASGNVHAKWNFPDPDKSWLVHQSSGGAGAWRAEWAYDGTNNTDSVAGPDGGVVAGEWVMLGTVWTPNYRNLIIGGTWQTADTDARTSISDSAAPLVIGGQDAVTSNNFNGDIGMFFAWAGRIPDAEFIRVANGMHPLHIDAGVERIFKLDRLSQVPWTQHDRTVPWGTPNLQSGPLTPGAVTMPIEDYVDPRSQVFFGMVPDVGGGLSIPVAMHSYRRRRVA